MQLLQRLIETPPAPADGWHAPVALRSREEQRRHALRGYLLRTWVDRVLHHAEVLLATAALLVFGYWFLDGPARDWLHEQRAGRATPAAQHGTLTAPPPDVAPGATPVPPTPSEPITGVAAALAEAVPLPYVTIDMTAPEQQRGIEGAERKATSQPVPKLAPQPTRLQIPAIGLDTPVYEVFVVDGAWEVAEYAAGFLNGTALPGEGGNTALAGHAGLRGAVFRNLGALAPGDEVFVDAGGRRYRYRVRETKAVWPTQVEVLDPTETPVLTMITCTNWDTQRLVVVADLVDSHPAP